MPYKAETGIVTLDSIKLESGSILHQVEVAFEWAGNSEKPAILICHALTGNHRAVGSEEEPGWWAGLIGQGGFIDTRDWQIITMNVLGGCDGTTGPASERPGVGTLYQTDFPLITIRDMVTVQYEALKKLGIRHLHAVIGGSLGGMQTLEFGIMHPDFMNLIIPLAVTPALSDYGIAFNAIGRKAIYDDPLWKNGKYDVTAPPLNGLITARMIGMVTYRSRDAFNERSKRRRIQEESGIGNLEYDVESYLHYQGEKLTRRFDANSYIYLLKAMDSHDIGRKRGGIENALSKIKAETLLIAFQDDLLYPPEVMKDAAERLQGMGTPADFIEIETKYGHDGFLVEFEKWGPIIKERLDAD
ncbi:homoserine O-acetyltransferase MetX [Falsibacillus pallidus]|uniref:Homoserine O-acetyltransferase n=1 Tax=Falsibacillus pallidus TaxID=493781 RepID=A0A370G7A7_9BACI|nr:homoserine O-acetyltransferase [Falsibacillus pallidus]RDI37913.1 homoserine O-acetyltransferase [Falsibacillus pallidus]